MRMVAVSCALRRSTRWKRSRPGQFVGSVCWCQTLFSVFGPWGIPHGDAPLFSSNIDTTALKPVLVGFQDIDNVSVHSVTTLGVSQIYIEFCGSQAGLDQPRTKETGTAIDGRVEFGEMCGLI